MADIQKEICQKIGNLCLTNADILSVMEGNVNRRQVNNALCKLVSHDFIERVEQGCYQLTDKGVGALKANDFYDNEAYKKPTRSPARRVKKRTKRDKVWAAIRILGSFNVADLVLRSGASIRTVQNYIRILRQAGYIAIIRKVKSKQDALQSNGSFVYRLIHNTGPLAPLYKEKTQSVFDPNNQELKELKPCL